MNMKPFLCILMLGLLTGCGSANAIDAPEPGPPGVFIDSALEQYLQSKFEAVKQCAQIMKGDYKDLSIVMMPPDFKCDANGDGCSGEFESPNFIRLSSPTIWNHEILHYLLYLETGDSDPAHQSPLFKDCG